MKSAHFSTIQVMVFIIFACSSAERDFIKIQKGKFTASIVETGELQAVRSRTIVMPRLGWEYGRSKIAAMIEEGTLVEEGDFVVQIDTAGVVKFLKEKENAFQIAEADFRNLLVRHENEKRQIQSQLETAQASFNLTKLQNEKIKFESEKRQRINALRFEKEQISRNKIQQRIQTMAIAQQNEVKIQQLTLFKLKNEIVGARRALDKARITAPMKGLIEYKQNWRTREKVRIGDELWPGAPILGIPDLSLMRVKTAINETDIRKVYLGQKVTIRLDAFPDDTFEGEIIDIARLCYEKEQNPLVKLFEVIVLLKKSDPILKPGMTVGCEIFIAELKNALFVPNEYVLKENSQYYLFLKTGSKIEKKVFEPVARNNQFTAIQGNFAEGQAITKFETRGGN